ncbi:MAG: DNA-formamidopyrimidine glycosylase [Longicatena sp.]
MPELPEVETVVRTLEHQLQHPTIKDCEVLWDNIIAYPDVDAFKASIKGKSIIDYRRHGKYLLFDLGDMEWVCHLRMEGKFYVQHKQDPYNSHTHVIFTLDDGRELRYHDTRKFGKMYLYEKLDNYMMYPCFQHIGMDAFDERITADYLYRLLHKKQTVLKAVLLNQGVIAGIGNIYADEICFAMKLHPETKISKLRKKDFEQLIYETRRILGGAIRAGGTTIRSYTSSLGVDGRFQLELKVHALKGEACPLCQTLIQKITVATRGTYFCKTCQKKR